MLKKSYWPGMVVRCHACTVSSERKTILYDNGTHVAPRICHGKIAVTDARRGAEPHAEREATDRAFMMDIKGHWI